MSFSVGDKVIHEIRRIIMNKPWKTTEEIQQVNATVVEVYEKSYKISFKNGLSKIVKPCSIKPYGDSTGVSADRVRADLS